VHNNFKKTYSTFTSQVYTVLSKKCFCSTTSDYAQFGITVSDKSVASFFHSRKVTQLRWRLQQHFPSNHCHLSAKLYDITSLTAAVLTTSVVKVSSLKLEEIQSFWQILFSRRSYSDYVEKSFHRHSRNMSDKLRSGYRMGQDITKNPSITFKAHWNINVDNKIATSM
jgi:hypothetical protein